MSNVFDLLEGWGVPAIIITVIAVIFVLTQIVGLIAQLCGKTLPGIFNVIRMIKNKLQENKKKRDQYNRVEETLAEVKSQQSDVKKLLDEINKHYGEDNIKKRDKWMLDVNTTLNWCKERGKVYDDSVKELHDVINAVKDQQEALQMNNKMTSEMFKQSCRRDILDFEHKIINARRADKPLVVSREEFRKIRKTYDKYEEFLATFGGTNGEVDDAMEVIRAAERGEYSYIEFLEDLRD